MNRILILLASLLVAGNVYALPPCPTSGVFHNCFAAYTFDDGDRYVGEWKNDQMHGHGTYTWANGEKYIGEFRDGRNTYGVQYSALGRLQGTFSNGEWCEECEPNANQLALVREIDPSHIAVVSKEQGGDLAQLLSDANRTQDDYQKCSSWFYAERFEYEGVFFENWADVLDKQFNMWGKQADLASELSHLCSPFLDSTRLVWIAPSEVDHSGGVRQISTALSSLPKNDIFEFVAALFLDEELGFLAHVGKTKEATLANIESDYKTDCIDDASSYGICEVQYLGDIVLFVWEIGGITAKETVLFFEDRYIGSRFDLIGSEFFAEAFELEVRKARIAHPELEFHLELVRNDQIVLWVSESLEVAASVIESFNNESLDDQASSQSSPEIVSTGTGFVVSKDFVATADHVLRSNDRGDVCSAISVIYRHDEYEATIADLDPTNDIGLLKLSKPISSAAKLRGSPDLRVGETAINYGFPLAGELSNSAKITSGAVNSLAGYNNNSAFIQFDAASQFGNSGGPVLDAAGNVIGVVSAKLDDAQNQLVNFATKSTILEGFLKANKVPFKKADLGEKLELPDIAEKAETFTVLVGCWE